MKKIGGENLSHYDTEGVTLFQNARQGMLYLLENAYNHGKGTDLQTLGSKILKVLHQKPLQTVSITDSVQIDGVDIPITLAATNLSSDCFTRIDLPVVCIIGEDTNRLGITNLLGGGSAQHAIGSVLENGQQIQKYLGTDQVLHATEFPIEKIFMHYKTIAENRVVQGFKKTLS